jgi:hypothetical protein
MESKTAPFLNFENHMQLLLKQDAQEGDEEIK